MMLGMLPWNPNEVTNMANTAQIAFISWGLCMRFCFCMAGKRVSSSIIKKSVLIANRTRLRWSTAFVHERTNRPSMTVNKISATIFGIWILK